MIEPSNDNLSIAAQCHLLSISRSGLYYKKKGESPLNLKLMRLIDEQYLDTPYYGSRQMARHLRRDGYCVGRHRTVILKVWHDYFIDGPVTAQQTKNKATAHLI
jgi:putative transposase